MSGMTKTFNTRINLSPETRQTLIESCNTMLGTAVDLTMQVKQAHWNIKGPQFFARHQLFDHLADHLRDWSDDLAERAATMGGYARGTIRTAAEGSVLPEYDLDAVDGRQHLRILAERYATFCNRSREAIETSQKVGDPVTEDLFTEILRGAELDLWFLESHLNT